MKALLVRDLRLALRSGGSAATALLFFLAVVVAMPFAVGPNADLLSTIGGATLWIGALLAGLLGLERLFQIDREDGSLDQMILSPVPLAAQVFIKSLAHWLVTGLPLTLMVPIFGLFLGMVRIRMPSVMTMCLPCLAMRKPAFSRARTASRCCTPGSLGILNGYLDFSNILPFE